MCKRGVLLVLALQEQAMHVLHCRQHNPRLQARMGRSAAPWLLKLQLRQPDMQQSSWLLAAQTAERHTLWSTDHARTGPRISPWTGRGCTLATPLETLLSTHCPPGLVYSASGKAPQRTTSPGCFQKGSLPPGQRHSQAGRKQLLTHPTGSAGQLTRFALRRLAKELLAPHSSGRLPARELLLRFRARKRRIRAQPGGSVLPTGEWN